MGALHIFMQAAVTWALIPQSVASIRPWGDSLDPMLEHALSSRGGRRVERDGHMLEGLWPGVEGSR